MLRPLISVVIIAYDRREFMLEAAESALNQTLEKKFYEIIVVKNFSDPTIDIFLYENGIVNIKSNNYLLSGKIVESTIQASGEFICFLEDDDLWSSGRLEAFSSLLKNYPDLDFYHNNYTYFKSETPKLSQFPRKKRNNYLTEVKAQMAKSSFFEFNKLLKGHSIYNLSSMIIRRELLLSQLGIFDDFGNDFVDGLVFYLSILFGRDLVIDQRKFTAIRVHNKNRSGIDIGTGEKEYVKHFNYLSESIGSKIIHRGIQLLLARIELDSKIKDPKFRLPSILKGFVIYLKQSLSCRRGPDFDMIIKFLFRLLGKRMLILLMKSYHS